MLIDTPPKIVGVSTGGVIYASTESGPFSPLADGLEIWAKDITWNRRYGGRIFRLFIPAKPGISPEGTPTLNWPEEDRITVEVVDEWPWGGTDPITLDNGYIELTYQNTPIAPPGVYCLQKEWDGIGPGAWLPYTIIPNNWKVMLHWFDNRFVVMDGGQAIIATAPGGYSTAFKDGERHRYVLFVRDGDAPPDVPNTPPRNPGIPHYNTWYRIFATDFWGRENRDGTYTCGGQAGFEEVTDPEEIALLNSYVENPPPYDSPLDSRLLPTPWRQ